MAKVLSFNQIKDILPFKYPFVLLDRAEIGDEQVRAVKNLSMNESFFQGHFPGNPITPGVLQVEAMTQTAILMMFDKIGDNRQVPQLKSAKRIKFRKPVLPGDRMVVEVDFVAMSEEGVMTVKARTIVDGAVTCQGELDVWCLPHPDQAIRPDEFLPAQKDLFPKENVEEIAVTDIMEQIPHRYPFLLVDRILYTNVEEMRSVGLKNVTGNEPFFSGYLNKNTMLPNSLQLEIAAQVGCVYSLALPENADKIAFFMSIDSAQFHHPVLPGDQLLVDLSLAGSKGRFGKAVAKLYVGEKLVTECVLKFAIVEDEAK